MTGLLDKYRKVAGTGPKSTIGLEDWNGLIDELASTLAGLIEKGAAFDAIATVAIGVLLDRINQVLGPAYDNVQARGQQVEALYARISGAGVSADVVLETADRLFLTAARRAAILAEIRGTVPAGRQTLQAINDAVVANTATLAAITGGADPTLDSFAEALARFVVDEGQISGLMTMVGNRLRGDVDGGYSAAQIAQFLANLGLTDRQPGVGDLVVTIGKVAPPGCLKLNGSLISRANYPALWVWAQANGNLITDALWTGGASAAFSQGDGSTTFRIPDFRGEFPRFWDDSRGLDAGRALGSVQAQSYQAHAHGFTGAGGGGYPNFTSDIMVMGGVTPDQYNQVGVPGFSGRPDYYYSGGRDDVRVASSGGAETRPRNVSPLACIRYK